MLIILSILCGFIISSILVAIYEINMKKFFDKKGLDVESHKTLLLNMEVDGKDTKDYNKYLRRVYIIYTIIFSILSYIILPKL